MKKASRTRYALMGALLDGPKSGYALRSYLNRVLDGFWRESYGQIYPTLRKLRAERLIDPVDTSEPETGSRTVYQITRRGREAFRDWVNLPADSEVKRSEFGLKLFFGSEVGPEVMSRHIERFRLEAEDRKRSCKMNAERIRKSNAGAEASYWLLGLELGEVTAQATIDWCNGAAARLAALDTLQT